MFSNQLMSVGLNEYLDIICTGVIYKKRVFCGGKTFTLHLQFRAFSRRFCPK